MIPALAVLLGCAVMAAATVSVPKHVAYTKARVARYSVRHGSKNFGVRIFAETPSGRSVIVNSRAYNPQLKEGALICLHEFANQMRPYARTRFTLAPPYKCAGL
ncbi:hypothetical protein ACIRQ6_08660 [Algirhabdus cladophorae]